MTTGAIPDTLPELVERVRTLAKAQTIGCTGHPGQPQGGCKACAGSDPNPAFADLLALVREKCSGWWHQTQELVRDQYFDCLTHWTLNDIRKEGYQDATECPGGCFGTGFVTCTAYVESLHNGATEGALVNALVQTGLSVNDELIDSLMDFQAALGDHRIPALQAVVRWLEEKP